MSRTLLFSLLLLAAPMATAGTPINQTRPLQADAQVSIDNLKGRIQVRTWDRNEIRVTGTLGAGVEKLVIEGSPGDMRIEVRYPQQNSGGWFSGWWSGDDSRSEPTDLQVTLPAGVALEIDSVSASVDIAGIAGRSLGVESVSGDVVVSQSKTREGRFDLVSGDLRLDLATGKLDVDVVSGDIEAGGGLAGDLAFETVSGSLRLQAGAVTRLEFSSVSGDAEVAAALAPNGVIEGETLSGSVDLAVPAATSAKVRAETFSGSIRSPVGQVVEEEHGPGSSLNAQLGAGSGRIQLESFSGDLNLRTR